MIKKIINEIKIEYGRSKLRTVFYLSMLTIAILSYIRPSSTESIWIELGISAMNLSILSGLIFAVWWFYWRKNK